MRGEKIMKKLSLEYYVERTKLGNTCVIQKNTNEIYVREKIMSLFGFVLNKSKSRNEY